MRADPSFLPEIARLVWEAKYRWREGARPAEPGIEETWQRVRELEVTDYACALFRQQGGKGIPPAFVAAHDVAPEDHLAMQAELQVCVDNAISKTLNVPRRFPYERFAPLYGRAYGLGLKGCTAYRAHAREGVVLEGSERPGCCAIPPVFAA